MTSHSQCVFSDIAFKVTVLCKTKNITVTGIITMIYVPVGETGSIVKRLDA